jgi:pimeloyl-ACP methyl ester carboxylesterase
MAYPKWPPATVVLFPTLLTGSWVWREQLPIFTSIGSPLIELPNAIVNWDVQPTLDSLDEYVLARLDLLPAPWLLVGCSLGGLMALRVALRRPDATAAVIGTGCPGLGRNPDLAFRPRFGMTFRDAAEVRAMLFADPLRLDDAVLLATLADIANRPAMNRGTRLARALNDYSVREALHKIRVPTTLIWGQKDRLTPPNEWRTLAEECESIHFTTIPEAGHAPMLEVPDVFNGILLNSIAELARG